MEPAKNARPGYPPLTVLLWFQIALLPACPGNFTKPINDSRRLDGTGASPDGDAAGSGLDRVSNDVVSLDRLKPDQIMCAGQCDDVDPCTSDACVSGQCVYTKIGKVIYRYYNSSTGAHAFGPTGSSFSGFAVEFAVFRTLSSGVSNAVPLYQQVSSNGDYMLSTSSSEGVACCGYSSWGSLGYAFPSQLGSAIPLYRHYQSSTGLHLSSTSATEGSSIGYSLEGATGYVCPL